MRASRRLFSVVAASSSNQLLPFEPVVTLSLRFRSKEMRERINTPTLEAFAKAAMRSSFACTEGNEPGRLVASSTKEIVVGMALVGERAMADLNRQYRRKKGPTDVLSFAAAKFGSPGVLSSLQKDDKNSDDGDSLDLGDVYICPSYLEAAWREANEPQTTLSSHFERIVVHGLLHLLGHDHERDDEAERMERMEAKVLKELQAGDRGVIMTTATEGKLV